MASGLVSASEALGTYTCMPYEYNLSQDVENCTLYLVLSHCMRTNALQATAVASKECPKFLSDGLLMSAQISYRSHYSYAHSSQVQAKLHSVCYMQEGYRPFA